MINDITNIIIQESIAIHKKLGPGLLESIYEEVLARCLYKRGLEVRRQVPIPVFYEDEKLDIGFRADLIVENKVIIEIKSVEQLSIVHPKILLTYLRTANMQVGLIINFHVAVLKDGIKRVVNNFNR